MRYLITLKPLEPFFFGGAITFGKLGAENSTYLVKSRHFPQQTALLGVIRKEILIQSGLLKRKRNGEWIEPHHKVEAKALVGDIKFEFNTKQDFKSLKNISPIFLIQEGKKCIKKVNIDSFEYKDGVLKEYTDKKNMYDNFITTDHAKSFKTEDVFESVEQVGNSKFDSENALYKKTSYQLKDNFKFAFYIELNFALKESFITLGGEKSSFKMEVTSIDETLEYQDKNNYLTLLSDAYITVPLKGNCDFAITSEISFAYLQNEFEGNKRRFKKSEKSFFLYEKGSVFIKPSQALLSNLDNQNLQKIGLNHYAYKKGKSK